MADGDTSRVAIEPTMWFLVFQDSSRTPWVNLLSWGRFKHVTAYGWVPDQRMWVFYDVSLGNTRIAILPAGTEAAQQEIERLREHGVTLAMKPRGKVSRWLRLGFWCVPAMAHLVGVPGCAVRPDRLFRQCLRYGAEIVDDG
ncbi:hypothetical protein DC522_05890 [Microvirga sp. KLBC 81]|uniref:hypothetical protein n=1 Tax=Microvirga sp. KLBC 81 TaxID=1862707 RepID=UPI000D50E977|nr:hypothetical protein [Microvirga sp. KLBC 81]PVE25424.1 hypothetical protein DC522_05890 [Microvirga sp. KLBC 81]